MSKKDVTVGMVYSYEAGLAEGQAEREELRRQLTRHVDLVNRRNEQVAELRRQVEELRRQLEQARQDLADSTAQLELDNEECVALRRQLADCRKALETEGESDV
jgi:chromosome segregation ATPase